MSGEPVANLAQYARQCHRVDEALVEQGYYLRLVKVAFLEAHNNQALCVGGNPPARGVAWFYLVSHFNNKRFLALRQNHIDFCIFVRR